MPADSPFVRHATHADIAAVRNVLVETWHATYDKTMGAQKVADISSRWHSIDQLSNELTMALERPDEHAFLVAEIEGVIAATASASLSASTITLRRLYVLPDHQGKGLGKALSGAVIAHFPRADRFSLEVEANNERAISVYRQLGLRVEGKGNACGGDSDAALAHFVMSATLPLFSLRPVRDDDAQDLFGLITLCFADYPGCFVDPHDDLPDLRTPAATFAGRDGAFWVIEDARGRVAACCAIDFPQADVAEVHRLYVRPDMRRAGLAQRLMDRCEALAQERGAAKIVLWSDTRFETAHRFYEKRGYRRGAEPRKLNDISHSLEYLFEQQLD